MKWSMSSRVHRARGQCSPQGRCSFSPTSAARVNCSLVRSIWPTISRSAGWRWSWLTSSWKGWEPVVTSPLGATTMRGISMNLLHDNLGRLRHHGSKIQRGLSWYPPRQQMSLHRLQPFSHLRRSSSTLPASNQRAACRHKVSPDLILPDPHHHTRSLFFRIGRENRLNRRRRLTPVFGCYRPGSTSAT